MFCGIEATAAGTVTGTAAVSATAAADTARGAWCVYTFSQLRQGPIHDISEAHLRQLRCGRTPTHAGAVCRCGAGAG